MAERPTEGRPRAADHLHAVSGPEALTRLIDAQAAAIEAVHPTIGGGDRLGNAGAGSPATTALADAFVHMTGAVEEDPALARTQLDRAGLLRRQRGDLLVDHVRRPRPRPRSTGPSSRGRSR